GIIAAGLTRSVGSYEVLTLQRHLMSTATAQGKSKRTFAHPPADGREATRYNIELKEIHCKSRNLLFIKEFHPIQVLGSIATQAWIQSIRARCLGHHMPCLARSEQEQVWP